MHVVLSYETSAGVDHFFIYNTANEGPRAQWRLQRALHDYIGRGTVTLVAWPYDNCVRGMASGKDVGWEDSMFPILGSQFFLPPPRLAQTAALASCYTRFKHSTKYLASIDDDEFLISKQRTIKEFIKSVFKRFPLAPAVYFRPIMVSLCPARAHEAGVLADRTRARAFNGSLPRLSGSRDAAQIAELGLQYEGKLIMRTAAVDMFHIHYVTQLCQNHVPHSGGGVGNDAERNRAKFVTIHPHRAALLHYRTPIRNSGSIFGRRLPIDWEREEMANCRGELMSIDPLHSSQPNLELDQNDSSSSSEVIQRSINKKNQKQLQQIRNKMAKMKFPIPGVHFVEGAETHSTWPREAIDVTRLKLDADLRQLLLSNYRLRMAG